MCTAGGGGGGGSAGGGHLGCLEINVAEIVQEKRVHGGCGAFEVVPARQRHQQAASRCGGCGVEEWKDGVDGARGAHSVNDWLHLAMHALSRLRIQRSMTPKSARDGRAAGGAYASPKLPSANFVAFQILLQKWR